jgi:Tol biopolymer transport system component
MYVSYRTIADRSQGLSGTEAATLALAALDACDRVSDRSSVLPPAEQILLSRTGAVALRNSAAAAGADRVQQIAGLVGLLLGLDSHLPATSRADVPGALLLLLARATGHIDLPAPSYSEFREALRRFGSPDRATLISIFLRYAPPAVRARRIRVPEAVAASLVVAAASAAFLAVAGGGGERVPSPGAMLSRGATTAVAAVPETSRSVLRPAMDVVMAGPLLSSAQIGADVFSPSFSNGRVLLFHAGRDRAALMRVSFERDGRPEITTVLRDGAANYHAVPSPDGRSLAFDSDRDGTRAVYVAGRDAAGARRISGEGYAAVPRWSPDSRKLAFIRADPARPRVWNVWVANVASGALQQVSRHRAGQAWGASWFPDGHRLAYSVEDSLIVSDLRDGTVRVTRSPRPGRLVRTPAVSPDGKWIVFQAYRDGVWLLEVSTGRTRRVLSDPSAEEFAWSPDGTRIVYHTRRGGAWSLWQLSFTQDEARAL